ncbi:hypothetical protein [Caldithrix abyssi]|uniref:hypothetical protein n=1 Tax=Caldithrix abyssi TaxID=187145 RepID=UPI0012375D97|nr:hypothetical protein [Caldithrix abyssi]
MRATPVNTCHRRSVKKYKGLTLEWLIRNWPTPAPITPAEKILIGKSSTSPRLLLWERGSEGVRATPVNTCHRRSVKKYKGLTLEWLIRNRPTPAPITPAEKILIGKSSTSPRLLLWERGSEGVRATPVNTCHRRAKVFNKQFNSRKQPFL